MPEDVNCRDWRQIAKELAAETNRTRIRQLLRELDEAMERAKLKEKPAPDSKAGHHLAHPY